MVISRAQSKETTANLASFGTDMIIDPFETFADVLALTLREPYKQIIRNFIVNPKHNVWMSPHQNMEGRWVVCGYKRLGKALHKMFDRYKIEATFIEINPAGTDAPEGTIIGTGTEAKTLLRAGIKNAVGVIAGTPDDADNLSIIITARQIKPDLITVARQNKGTNKPVFRAAEVNIIMEPGRTIANEIYLHLRTPLLTDFFKLAREQSEQWARQLIERISDAIEHSDMDAWTLIINKDECMAVQDALECNHSVKVSHLCDDPRDRDAQLPIVPLLLKRDKSFKLLPAPETLIKTNDQILFCGQEKAQTYMRWAINNHNAMRYIKSGRVEPDGIFWRWLHRKRLKPEDKAQ